MSEKLIPPSLLNALKTGAPISDPKLSALRTFVLALVGQHAWIQQSELQAFLDAGYTRAQICEVTLAVVQKMLANYLNHIAGTPVDQVFQAHLVADLKRAG
jgi:alkylhydroperoxidase family enzyme